MMTLLFAFLLATCAITVRSDDAAPAQMLCGEKRFECFSFSEEYWKDSSVESLVKQRETPWATQCSALNETISCWEKLETDHVCGHSAYVTFNRVWFEFACVQQFERHAELLKCIYNEQVDQATWRTCFYPVFYTASGICGTADEYYACIEKTLNEHTECSGPKVKPFFRLFTATMVKRNPYCRFSG